MSNISIQEIAKKISQIDWISVQSDSVDANEQVYYYKLLLQKLSTKDAIELLMKVLEANYCENKYPEEFSTLKDFNYINEYISVKEIDCKVNFEY